LDAIVDSSPVGKDRFSSRRVRWTTSWSEARDLLGELCPTLSLFLGPALRFSEEAADEWEEPWGELSKQLARHGVGPAVE
jgi:hypothetical protein